MSNSSKIQVFVVSQQSLFRQGVEQSLSGIEDIVISGATGIKEQVLTAIDNLPPDVTLVDLDGQADTGLELAQGIKQRSPSIGVIIITSKPDDNQFFRALKAQAMAYLSKEVTSDHLAETIRRVAKGEYPINESMATSPKIAEQVLRLFQKRWRSGAPSFISPLTLRETEILKYIGRGFLNKQIAAKLGISEQSIKNHVTSILRKLNANARTEAVVVAIKQGLITIT